MTAIEKVTKILKSYPDLGNFDGHYTAQQFFVENGKLKVYHNSYDYHGKSGDGKTLLATEKEAKDILERLEKRLVKAIVKQKEKENIEEFYG
jgi:NADPH-dependent 7-cyano-7-deazaguanine reductase QueF